MLGSTLDSLVEIELHPTPTHTAIEEHRSMPIDEESLGGRSAPEDTVQDILHTPSRSLTYTLPKEACWPWLGRVAALVVLSSLPAVLFGVAFTYIGKGQTVFLFVKQYYGYSEMVGYAGLLILFLLYVLDASYWRGAATQALKAVFFAIAGLCLLVGAVLMAKVLPSVPLLMFLLSLPAYYGLLRKSCFRRTPLPYFLNALSFALLVGGTVGVLVWALWVVETGWAWPGSNDIVKIRFYEFMDCPLPPGVNSTSPPPAAPELESCQAAFLLWASLVIASFIVVCAGVVANLLGKSLIASPNARTSPVTKQLRIFVTLTSISVAGMWVAGSIAGSSLSMSNLVMTFSFAFLFGVVVSVFATVGPAAAKGEFAQSKLGKGMSGLIRNDWAKAFLCFAFPAATAILAVSWINQGFRVYLTPCTTRHLDRDEKLTGWKDTRLTVLVSRQWSLVRRWPWTSVLMKVQFIALVYFFFNVLVGKITYVFLSELNLWLRQFPLAAVTGIFFLVGLLMFLNPAIPGVPVYLVGGVLLVSSAESMLGFWGACAYTTVICYLIKVVALYMQQQWIGGKLGKNVGIRQMVGVNSRSIRAMRLILERPGMSMAKVSILCGGPDWPVGVMTGILKQNPLSMQLGTFPIVLLVAPCVFAGAFMLKPDEDFYASLSSVALAVASSSQAIALLAALYFIDKEVSRSRAQLDAMVNDEEVLRADAEVADAERVRAATTEWSTLPGAIQFCLCSGGLFSVCFCYVFGFWGSAAFVEYRLIDSVATKLGGNVANLVQGIVGWVAIGMGLYVFLTYEVVNAFAKRRVAKEMSDRTKIVPKDNVLGEMP